jgi:hypothetical protein
VLVLARRIWIGFVFCGGTLQAIKIVDVPPGEAPQEVRGAWVGLVLPLAEPEKRRIRSAGILNGPKTYFRYILRFITGQCFDYEGYVVESATAIAILAQSNPEAADWWKKNSPHLLNPGQHFFMQAEFCQEVPAVTLTWPPPPSQPVV